MIYKLVSSYRHYLHYPSLSIKKFTRSAMRNVHMLIEMNTF